MKKSYTGLIIWLIIVLAVIISLCNIPFKNPAVMMRLLFTFTATALAVLMFMIYKTDKLYWFNTVSYEDIVNAGYERRQWYAWKVFKRFALFAIVCFVLSLLLHLFGGPFWIDIIVFTVGLVAVAINVTTIRI